MRNFRTSESGQITSAPACMVVLLVLAVSYAFYFAMMWGFPATGAFFGIPNPQPTELQAVAVALVGTFLFSAILVKH